MTTPLVALVLLSLMTGTAMAQQAKAPEAKAPQAKVTSLMSKDLPESPGKEALMITVVYPPGSSDPAPPTQCPCDSVRTGRLRRDVGEGWKAGHPDTRTDLL